MKAAKQVRPAKRRPDLSERDALRSIQGLLSGREWDADTLSEIAEIVRRTGRAIDEPTDIEDAFYL